MTREEAKQLLPIITAFTEGKTIISRKKCKEAIGKDGWSEFNDWEDCKTPTFDIENFDYRIKPEPTYRPFKNAEECWQEMQKHQPFGWVKSKANGIYAQIMEVLEHSCFIQNIRINFKGLNFSYTFADGQPFGIKEED